MAKMTTVALWMVVAVVVLVTVADAKEARAPAPGPDVGWTDSVKEKAGEAADGVKSWKDWAVGKIHKTMSPAPAPAPATKEGTDRLGEANHRMPTTTKSGRQMPQKHGPNEL